MELLKSFTYLINENEINEVKELLHLYYKHKLDAAIDKEEAKRTYTADIYEMWLKAKKKVMSQFET